MCVGKSKTRPARAKSTYNDATTPAAAHTTTAAALTENVNLKPAFI
jgi:hypothetical protein